MRMNWVKSVLAVATIAALVIAAIPEGRGGESIELSGTTMSVELADDAEVTIVVESADGDISVVREDRTSVSFTVEKYDERDEDRRGAAIERDEEADLIRLRLRGDLRDSDIVVRAPLSAGLRLRVQDGDITVTGGWGDVDASAADGHIALREMGGAIVASSNDGDLVATLAAGRKAGPISLATHDGNIRLLIAEELDADVSVSTMDGEFECDVPLTLRGGSGERGTAYWKRGDGVDVEATLGQGGDRLSLKTIDGDVQLLWKDGKSE